MRCRSEIAAATAAIGRGNVRDPDVQECAGPVRVCRGRERHHGFVIGRAARVEDQPLFASFKMTGSRSSTTAAPNTDR